MEKQMTPSRCILTTAVLLGFLSTFPLMVEADWLSVVRSAVNIPEPNISLPMESINNSVLEGGTFDATLTGQGYGIVPGVFGNAVRFNENGAEGYANYTDMVSEPCAVEFSDATCPTGLTVMMWIKLPSMNLSESLTIFSTGPDASGGFRVFISASQKRFYTYLRFPEGKTTTFYGPLKADEWYHITMTVAQYTGTRYLSLYANGDHVYTRSQVDSADGSDTPLFLLGYNDAAHTDEFLLDELTFWYETFTETQIADVFRVLHSMRTSGYQTDCTVNDDCSSLYDMQCNQDTSQCDCPVGFMFNPLTTTCIIAVSRGDVCQSTEDCKVFDQKMVCGNDHRCACQEGYIYQSLSRLCVDLNECDNLTTCAQSSSHHLCINTEGSYECSCETGYTWNNDSCENDDECTFENGGCQHVCNDTDGSFHCLCHDGYVLNDDKRTCRDTDECDDMATCAQSSPNHLCLNTEGSYTCSCEIGYTWNNGSCSNNDECLSSNGGCEHTCNDTDGSFSCSCHEGYVLNPDHKTCQDYNECEDNNGGCDHMCLNSPGSRYCTCRSGYVLANDTTSCYIADNGDGCSVFNGGCQHLCSEGGGSLNCSCHEGYVLNNDLKTCKDLNECDDVNTCGQTTPHHVCINTEGSYRCGCETGYTWTNGSCSNDDECGSLNGGCQHLCVDTEGSFNCSCYEGYVLNGDQKTCRDYDECGENNGGCEHRCLNSPGSRYCTCRSGYVLDVDGTSCYLAGGGSGVPVKIKFDGDFKDWMLDFSNGKTKALARAMENEIHAVVLNRLTIYKAAYENFYVSRFESSSVLVSADLYFREKLTDFQISHVTWLLSELLEGVSVTSDDVTLTVSNTDRVQAVRSPDTVVVQNACSIVDYENLCGEHGTCQEVTGEEPTCACNQGFSGDTCTPDGTNSTQSGSDGNDDDDTGMAADTVLMIVCLCILPVLVVCVVAVIIYRKRPAQSNNSFLTPIASPPFRWANQQISAKWRQPNQGRQWMY